MIRSVIAVFCVKEERWEASLRQRPMSRRIREVSPGREVGVLFSLLCAAYKVRFDKFLAHRV
jgi:hypothetical protein